MIQGKLVGGEFPIAVMTNAPAEKFLKKCRFPQLSGFLAFPFYMGIVFIDLDPVIH